MGIGNSAIGGLAAIAITAGAGVGYNEHSQNSKAEHALMYLDEYAEIAKVIYQRDNAWPADLATIQANSPSAPPLNEYGAVSVRPRADGALLIELDTDDIKSANRLSGLTDSTQMIVNGDTVSFVIMPPSTLSLDEIYAGQVDNTMNDFGPTVSIDANGGTITNVTLTQTDTLSTSCVVIGSSNICEDANGHLQISTSMVSLSQNAQIGGEIAASVVNVVNELRSGGLTATDLVSQNLTATELISAAANFTHAEATTLNSVAVEIRTALVEELTATGNTELANLVADEGSLTSITGTDFEVSGRAVINHLESNRLTSSLTTAQTANIAQTIAQIGEIQNLTANLAQINDLLTQVAVIDAIQSVTFDSRDVTITNGDIVSLNSEIFKAKVADLGIATITNHLNAGQATIRTMTADDFAVDVLAVETINAQATNASDLQVSGTLQSENVNVVGSTNVLGDVNVNELTKAQLLQVNRNANIQGILNSVRIVVGNDLHVSELLSARNLEVTRDSEFNQLTISNRLTAQNLDVATTITTDSINATGDININDLNVGGELSVDNLNAAQVNSQNVTSNNTNISQIDVGSLVVNGATHTKELTSNRNASIFRANIEDILANTTLITTLNADQFAVADNIRAMQAELQTLDVSHAATLQNVNIEQGLLVRGAMNVVGDNINAINITANIVNASTLSGSDLSGSTLSALSNVTGNDLVTRSGASLQRIGNYYSDHEIRIAAIEQFKQDCINNWELACSATFPEIVSKNCTNCDSAIGTQNHITAIATATVQSCPAGCTYSWSVTNNLYKNSGNCSNGSVTSGNTKNVSCSFRNKNSFSGPVDGQVTLIASHQQRSSVASTVEYDINWRYQDVNPVIASWECINCEFEQQGSGAFNATVRASIQRCENGCNYQWITEAGVGKAQCSNGSVSGGNASVQCRINASPQVLEGTTLNSSIKLVVTNQNNSALRRERSDAITWKHKRTIPAWTHNASRLCKATPRPVGDWSNSCTAWGSTYKRYAQQLTLLVAPTIEGERFENWSNTSCEGCTWEYLNDPNQDNGSCISQTGGIPELVALDVRKFDAHIEFIVRGSPRSNGDCEHDVIIKFTDSNGATANRVFSISLTWGYTGT